MRLLCCAYPRCRKVSRGNSEQAPRCAHRRGTDHLPCPCAGGMVADDNIDRHRSLASARSACCCPKRRGTAPAPYHLAPDCGDGRRGHRGVRARNRSLRCHSRMRSTAGGCWPPRWEPFLGATQALPAIAIAPILVLWVGYGITPVIVLCALMVFSDLYPPSSACVISIRELLEAAALDGATGWTMAAHMELPLAAPAILGGLRNGFALSVTGAVVGEMVMGGSGLGQVLTQ